MKSDVFEKNFLALEKGYVDGLFNDGDQELLEKNRSEIYSLFRIEVIEHQFNRLAASDIILIEGFLCAEIYKNRGDYLDDAVLMLERLADRGSAPACNGLADLYSGYICQTEVKYKRMNKARLLFEKSAASGDLFYGGYAHARLAQIEADGYDCPIWGDSRRDNAIRHASISAYQFSSPYGQVLLSGWYYDGSITTKDWNRSHELLSRAYQIVLDPWWNYWDIKSEVYFQYGFNLYNGHGCQVDEDLGFNLILQAATNKNQMAIDWLKGEGRKEGLANKISTRDDSSTAALQPLENPMSYFSISGQKQDGQTDAVKNKIKNKKELQKLLKPLNDMTGCNPVKQKIESLAQMSVANSLRAEKGLPVIPMNMHAAFMGAPGTGKTTVARMYAKLLHGLGYLSQGHMIEVTRTDITSPYFNEGPQKLRNLVEQALGGVLFIDEAYALSMQIGSSSDIADETVAEMISCMETFREDIVFIFAGYTDEMKAFMRSNPGLASRVPNIIVFPDYTAEEMLEIFEKLCDSAEFLLTAEARQKLKKYLTKLDGESIRRMGNARGIRNIFEESMVRQSCRILSGNKRSKKALMTLDVDDITLPGERPDGHLVIVKN